MGLDARTVVIIGGSSGIGLASARLIATRGARPVVVGRDHTKLDAAEGKVRAAVMQ